MRSEAWRKPPSARPRESGDLEMLDSRFRGNERRKETPRWSAERRASRVVGRKAPRKRLAYRVESAFTRVFDAHDTPHGCLARTRTSLGAPPTLFPGERSKGANPGCRHAPREGGGVCA